MIKKIFGVIVILGLAVGSFFGIYFGVKFDKVNKQLKSDIEYIQTIDTLNKELSQTKNDYIKLNDNYVVVVAENELNKKEVNSLKISIQEKEEIIQGLQSTITEKVNKISEIETEKSILETEKEDLLSQIETMTEEQIAELARLNNKISDLEKEKSTLTSEKAELQTQYDNMLVEKNNLLLDKQTLENRIEDNNKKIANYESQILQLQNEITRLTTLLESYEELINETHIVTFYIGDEIYSAKAVRYGKTISEFEVPQETNSYIFNYWTLDHETEVDILTMPITEDVSVYANYTPKYKVEFESVGEMISTQYIVDGQSIQMVESPIKEGYVFLGWSLNGLDVIQNLQSFSITENVTLYAVFTTVIEYDVRAVSFNLSSLRGDYVWSVGENVYYSNYGSQYELDKETSTWIKKTWNGLTLFYGNHIWKDGENIYYSEGSTQYVLDRETSTWIKKDWNNLKSFNGVNVWSDGENIYYSLDSSQYVLDKETSTWNVKVWNVFNRFYGSSIWFDGENICYMNSGNNYIFNKSTLTWEEKDFNAPIYMNGVSVWSIGGNIYYSSGSSQYLYNKNTCQWTEQKWSGSPSIYGQYVWSDGENTYFSFNGNSCVFYKK